MELWLISVRLGTVFLLYFCAHAVTGEVDIQLTAELHPVLNSTSIHCGLIICQSLQQVLYVYHLLPSLLITIPDICLRSQNKPEFKFRPDSHFRAFHLCLRYLFLLLWKEIMWLRQLTKEFIGGLVTVLEGWSMTIMAGSMEAGMALEQ